MSRVGKASTDAIKRLKEYFLDHPEIDYEKLAEMSASICGQEVVLDAIKRESAADGNWYVERNSRQYGKTDEISEEINHVRQIVYQQILVSNEGGLFISAKDGQDFNESEIVQALSKLHWVKVVKIKPGGVDAAMVNAYMNLLSKTNVPISLSGTSGKTSREQAIEMIRKVQEEL